MIAVARRVRRLVTCLGHSSILYDDDEATTANVDCTGNATKSTFEIKGTERQSKCERSMQSKGQEEGMQAVWMKYCNTEQTNTQRQHSYVLLPHIQSRRPKAGL